LITNYIERAKKKVEEITFILGNV